MLEDRVRADSSAAGTQRVTAAFDAFAEREGLPSLVIGAVQVALDELLSNVVKAGYAEGESGWIEAAFVVRDGRLEIVVEDDGAPFDPLARADPDTAASLEERPVGGLGIYLVKQLMDEVGYERADGRNRLRLLKNLEGSL